MTFLALLTKELRLRLRRERSIWVIVVYILLMGLLGWFLIAVSNNTPSYSNLDRTGQLLYYLLSMVQLFLIMFITPAFTATAVNGEKERQTYELLITSRLSSFSLVSGKLLAGLTNAFLLIAASVPLFSLVFFFGGVSPVQVLSALSVFITTTILLGTFGLFCSTVFNRPAISTAVTYMTSILWMIMPLIILYLWTTIGRPSNSSPAQFSTLFSANPVSALVSTYPGGVGGIFVPLSFGKAKINIWVVYSVGCLVSALLFFLMSMWAIKPNPTARLAVLIRNSNIKLPIRKVVPGKTTWPSPKSTADITSKDDGETNKSQASQASPVEQIPNETEPIQPDTDNHEADSTNADGAQEDTPPATPEPEEPSPLATEQADSEPEKETH